MAAILLGLIYLCYFMHNATITIFEFQISVMKSLRRKRRRKKKRKWRTVRRMKMKRSPSTWRK